MFLSLSVFGFRVLTTAESRAKISLANYIKKQVSMIRKYHNCTLHPNPRHREKEPQNTNSQSQDIRKTNKVKQPTLSPHQDVCKTRNKKIKFIVIKSSHRTVMCIKLHKNNHRRKIQILSSHQSQAKIQILSSHVTKVLFDKIDLRHMNI